MQDYTQTSQALARLLEKRFSVDRADLATHLAALGAKMPARLRRDLGVVLEAETLSGHPKQARLIPEHETSKAARRARRALQSLDIAAEKAQARRRRLGFLAFNCVLALAALIAGLAMTGLIGPR